MHEGARYDLALDLGHRLLRVQCKLASFVKGALSVHLTTSRLTPSGDVRTRYSAREIDAVGVYSPHTARTYLLPIEEVAGLSMLRLRVTPSRNNQKRGVRLAEDYLLPRTLGRLGCELPTSLYVPGSWARERAPPLLVVERL